VLIFPGPGPQKRENTVDTTRITQLHREEHDHQDELESADRAVASYGVPALSFGLEATKRAGCAPSTLFGSRPSAGHISNAGGCLSTLLARIRNKPLCVKNHSFAVYARALLGSTI
jgi:hypothetical protein